MKEEIYLPIKASSLIAKIKLCGETITVYFTNGKEIEYLCSRSEELFHSFCNSESIGKFWHKYIKDVYEYKIIHR